MKTLQLFSAKPETIPASASWCIADLSEARGRQELHMRKVPQRLRALREHALIESAVSSNRIEQNKERYYETLEQSSQRWHEGKHDPWPYINYLLFILKTAYREFENRLESTQSPRGAKTAMIEAAAKSFTSQFTVADLERKCPGVSHDMVRKVISRLQKAGEIECLGRGPGALWIRKGSTPKRG